MKRNYFATCAADDFETARAGLQRWVMKIAGAREHGTTRRQPLEMFESEERAAMRPLPGARFEPARWHRAKVHDDAHVLFDRRMYSVPWTLLGKQAWVRATARSVVVYVDDERVATHDRRGSGQRSTVDAHLPLHRRDLRHRDEGWWLEQADAMGAEVGAFMREVLASDRELSLLSTVQAMVSHLRGFPAERARRACQRASRFGNHSYVGLRDLLAKGLDFEPLPGDSEVLPGALVTAVHARDLRELLGHHLSGRGAPGDRTKEVPHELH